MMLARFSLVALATIAAGLVWLGIALSGAAGLSGQIMLGLGGVILAGPLFLMIGAQTPPLARLAVLVLAGVPTLGLMLALGTAGAQQLARFDYWPFAVGALAASLAILSTDAAAPRDPMPLACFPMGAAVLGATLVALALPATRAAMPGALPMLTATPVHLALAALAATILAALAISVARGELTASGGNFLRALIGLLPLLGFTGTILGIMRALSALPQVFDATAATAMTTPDEALGDLLAGLATAFETTLIGLVAAALCGFLLSLLATMPDADTRA